MIECNNHCNECGKYRSFSTNGGSWFRYHCLAANKDVILKDGDNGEVIVETSEYTDWRKVSREYI